MDYAAARQHMIDSQIRTNKVTDPAVIEALASVPREAFVAEAQKKLAYIDRPVAIGAGRRMTEPMVLARLLQVAHLKLSDSVLVVGAGTGYSAAILSRLVKKVVALESAPELAERAMAILASLGVGNVGYGWLRAAPGIGGVLVTGLLAVRPVARHVGRTLYVAVAVFAVMTIVLGVTSNYTVAFVALLVFLIAAMDHPFLGEFSVGPDAFVALRQQMPT